MKRLHRAAEDHANKVPLNQRVMAAAAFVAGVMWSRDVLIQVVSRFAWGSIVRFFEDAIYEEVP